jgi:hypothetical protein
MRFNAHLVGPSIREIVRLPLLAHCQTRTPGLTDTYSYSTPSFFAVIPGGNAFPIPNSTLSQITNFGTGFNWTPPLRVGTTVLITGGDNRGIGSAGSAQLFIQQSANNNNTCITDSSPSSTAGTPAGGAYPTSGTGGSSGSGYVFTSFFLFLFLGRTRF